jgi:hypothetical protein
VVAEEITAEDFLSYEEIRLLIQDYRQKQLEQAMRG